jgi:hypothetical protein
MADEIGYVEAVTEVLDPLLAASNLLHVVDRAERAGVLRLLRDGADIPTVSEATGLSAESVHTLCAALIANGVAEQRAGSLQLTPPWRAMTADGALIRLSDSLTQSRVVDAMLSGRETDYASLSPQDRSAFAHAVSPNPFARELVDRTREDIAKDPWWSSMLEGGRHLELGCGIAGRMLTMVQAMPKLYAVGIELDPDLAQEARERAAQLGVEDRVEIVTGDATRYRGDRPFDSAFWSQWFFPSPTREAALATLRANLRSGAVVRSPVFGDHDRIAEDPFGKEARQYTLLRVMIDAWGVPERTPDQLKTEFEHAGFVDVAIVPRDIAVTIYARRP